MFIDEKYSVGQGGKFATIQDAANYLFDTIHNYISAGEQDVEGLGLSWYRGELFEKLGIITTDENGNRSVGVDREQFINIMTGKNAAGEWVMEGNQPENHQPGSEIHISFDADYNALLAAASPEEKKIILQCMDEAADEALDELAKLERVRVKEGGVSTHEAPVAVGYMKFRHFEARQVSALVETGEQTRPDSSVHYHIARPNIALCQDGKYRALEGSHVKDNQTFLDQVARNSLSRKLGERLGLHYERVVHKPEAWEAGRRESFQLQIVGIEDPHRALHGHRTTELKKAAKAKVAEKIAIAEARELAGGAPVSKEDRTLTGDEEKAISKEMRAEKDAKFTQRVMYDEWRKDLDGLTINGIKQTHDVMMGKIRHDKAEFVKATFSAEDLIEKLLTGDKQAFSKKEFRDLYFQHQLGTGKTTPQITADMEAALKEHAMDWGKLRKHKYDAKGDLTEQHYTSKKLYEAEKLALEYVKEQKGKHINTISRTEATKLIAEWEAAKSAKLGKPIALSAEQREAALLMTTGAGCFQMVQGVPGSGKTATVECVAYCLKRFTMAGSAVAGVAAKNLKNEALGDSAKAYNVAQFLEQYKKNPETPVPQIMFLDEAVTADSRQVSELLRIGREGKNNMRIIGTGDLLQNQAVGPSGLVKDIEEVMGSAKLVEIRRQRNEQAKEISVMARSGDLNEFLSKGIENGWIKVAKDDAEKFKMTAEAFLLDPAPLEEKLAMSGLKRECDEVNRQIRVGLKEQGKIKGPGKVIEVEWRGEASKLLPDEKARTLETREFCVGDRIIIKEGILLKKGSDDKPKFTKLETGERGTIVHMSPTDDYSTVRFDDGREISWNIGAKGQNRIDHAFAGSVHSLQGQTKDGAMYTDSTFGDRNLFGVGCSRHRDRFTLITTERLLYGDTEEQRVGKSEHQIVKPFVERYANFNVSESTIKTVEEVQALKAAAQQQPELTAEIRALVQTAQGIPANTIQQPTPAQVIGTAANDSVEHVQQKATGTHDVAPVVQEQAQTAQDTRQAAQTTPADNEVQPVAKTLGEAAQTPSARENEFVAELERVKAEHQTKIISPVMPVSRKPSDWGVVNNEAMAYRDSIEGQIVDNPSFADEWNANTIRQDIKSKRIFSPEFFNGEIPGTGNSLLTEAINRKHYDTVNAMVEAGGYVTPEMSAAKNEPLLLSALEWGVKERTQLEDPKNPGVMLKDATQTQPKVVKQVEAASSVPNQIPAVSKMPPSPNRTPPKKQQPAEVNPWHEREDRAIERKHERHIQRR